MIDPALTTPDARLQLAFAKVALTRAELAQAETLARRITDWEAALDTARRNFSLPNMRRHVRAMAQDSVPAPVRARLDASANGHALRNLILIAAQRRFQERCLQPLGIEGLFFKGVNLASQYYPDPGLRPCRDIDILVPRGTLPVIVRHAIAAGYRHVIPSRPERPLTGRAEIEAALQYRKDATLISADGVAIDLQVRLDKHSGIFDRHDPLAIAVPMTLGGARFLTMPTAFLFNYICHHHARHVWARLHWLSDLDAMVTSPRFERAAVLALADRLGQRGTVEAALELQRLMSPGAAWEPGAGTDRGLQFLDLCLRNLDGDLDQEKRVAFPMIGGEFMFDWQARPDLVRRARWQHRLHVLQPTIQQYDRCPLPRGLRWLYVFPRLMALAGMARDRTRKPQ